MAGARATMSASNASKHLMLRTHHSKVCTGHAVILYECGAVGLCWKSRARSVVTPSSAVKATSRHWKRPSTSACALPSTSDRHIATYRSTKIEMAMCRVNAFFLRDVDVE